MNRVRPPDFGERLTLQQYEARIVALHTGRAPALSPKEERELRRRELDLMVDYRLGAGFPTDRREALWQQQQRLDRHRLFSLIGGALTHPTNPMKGMAKAQVRGFSRVLDRVELAALLDLTDAELSELF